MLFIKNLIKKNEVRLSLTEKYEEEKDSVVLSLAIGEESPVTLMKTDLEGVSPQIIRSLEHIGECLIERKMADSDSPLEKTVSVKLSDNDNTVYDSEINFHVKGVKTVIKHEQEAKFPVDIIGYNEEDRENDVYYPRDMVLFLLPSSMAGNKKEWDLVVDRRNTTAVIDCPVGESYHIFGMLIKWPIWAKLKYPAYAYIKDQSNNGTCAVKLSYAVNGKFIRNKVEDVELDKAKDYLDGTFLREQKKDANQGNGNRRGNYKHPYSNNKKEKERIPSRFNSIGAPCSNKIGGTKSRRK